MCTSICTHTYTYVNVPNDYVEPNARCKLLWWQIEIGALPCMCLARSLAHWIVSIEMLFSNRYHLGEIAIDFDTLFFFFFYIVQLNFDIAACITTTTSTTVTTYKNQLYLNILSPNCFCLIRSVAVCFSLFHCLKLLTNKEVHHLFRF